MLWSLQSHYDLIMSWQLHLVLGDAANRSKQPFIKTNSNAASFRPKMEDMVTVRQCKYSTVPFKRADIWMEAAKRWRKRRSTATRQMARRLASLSFLPKALKAEVSFKALDGVWQCGKSEVLELSVSKSYSPLPAPSKTAFLSRQFSTAPLKRKSAGVKHRARRGGFQHMEPDAVCLVWWICTFTGIKFLTCTQCSKEASAAWFKEKFPKACTLQNHFDSFPIKCSSVPPPRVIDKLRIRNTKK